MRVVSHVSVEVPPPGPGMRVPPPISDSPQGGGPHGELPHGDGPHGDGLMPPMRPIHDLVQDAARLGWRDVPGLLSRAFGLVWRAGRREFVLTALLQLVAGVGIAAQLLVAKGVFDGILTAGGPSGATFTSILPTIVALAALIVTIDVLGALRMEQNRILGELVTRYTFDRILEISTRVDLLSYESAEFHDRLRRAHMTGAASGLQLAMGSLNLVGELISVVGIVIAMVVIQPLLVPVVLIGYVPLWIVGRLNSGDLYLFRFGMTPNDRMRDYLQRLMMGRDAAKEVRSFNLGPSLRQRHDQLYQERIHELRALARRRTLRSVLGALAQSALTALAIGGLAYLFVSGRMDLASTGAAVFGLYQLSGRLSAIHLSTASLYEAVLFMRDYDSFLALKPALDAAPKVPAPQSFERLEVGDVSFKYPEAARPALSGVSLEVRAGEIIALVGENGSGKTTLAKVLAGLYQPDQGSVRWDGIDIAEVDRDQLRRSISVIFQDFERYLLSARENIGFGRVERADDKDAVAAAARRGDAHDFIAALPDGYETLLGREWLGGYDLSIGQWQRVALARAFFRDAPFIILDEPTAALDARAESVLFDRMRELLDGRTVVFISHRFSSVRSADRIYVLQRGKVTEQGTHAELMQRGGHYAELYTLQASTYAE